MCPLMAGLGGPIPFPSMIPAACPVCELAGKGEGEMEALEWEWERWDLLVPNKWVLVAVSSGKRLKMHW